MTFTAESADGRRLAFEVWGPPDGFPVFLLHGTPGSRLGPRPGPDALSTLGVRLIAYDRPGYGGSDRAAGRDAAQAASDVASIADSLGIGSFAVVGRSGGAPHALACAALLSGRVRRTAALVSLAPRDSNGLDWFAGMTATNLEEFTDAGAGLATLTARIEAQADRIRRDPIASLPFYADDLPECDRRVLADPHIRAMLGDNFVEALKYSGAGWVDDDLAFCGPWGFDLADIKVPVYLWHGAQDTFSPVGHTLWLAGRIPNATLVVDPDQGHFGAIVVLPQVLAWVVQPDPCAANYR
jgi:pimeloyl-ACP methyl ester carboxylesterase